MDNDHGEKMRTSATKWRSLRVLLQKNSILYGRQ